jgi:hypothetical protein
MSNRTPLHWRNVRLSEQANGRFDIVTYYVFLPFGPMAKKALGLAPDTVTDGLELEAALALGEKMEQKLVETEAGVRRGKN